MFGPCPHFCGLPQVVVTLAILAPRALFDVMLVCVLSWSGPQERPEGLLVLAWARAWSLDVDGRQIALYQHHVGIEGTKIGKASSRRLDAGPRYHAQGTARACLRRQRAVEGTDSLGGASSPYPCRALGEMHKSSGNAYSRLRRSVAVCSS